MSTATDRKEDLYALDLTGLPRRKSPLSTDDNNCVEITDLPGGGVAFTDSKRPDRSDLRFTKEEWAAFTEGIRRGLL
ncbi:DUF397 domain-containing protein [Kitasatospora sp. RB6PN24]|uniref:DUF397 domain-containing protein n=1 Tax=Kitasatospora humi TaxID=2893891 RepID=UPI001E34E17C|nr:DUF397 domain-containing protein [Kitasatospora humi]MCC9311143.1 DUF397 domain-containing protein [Kitasatospora humi]